MQEVYDFLKKCGTYYIATVDGDQPRVRPFGTVDIFEGKLYIQTGHGKDVDNQIKANPKVEICGFCEGQWLRVAATLVGDERIEAQQHMLDAYPSLQGRYKAGDGVCAVYWLKDATATFASFGGAPKVVKF
jgi:uncharacterized pyridoxamine 5'-phosphate oxidase family protein